MQDPTSAAGGVLWHLEGTELLVALVHRPAHDDWSLPKGKLHGGEHPLLAAVREVGEETGAEVAVGRCLGRTEYRVTEPGGEVRGKQVDWWAMQASAPVTQPDGEEVDEVAWLPPREARARLSHASDAEPLDRFLAGPARVPAVLLVRHASAGDPHRWHGPDADRPLDAKGERQAARLVGLLEAFRPEGVRSAPPLRCRQTVEPFCAATGSRVVVEPALGEEGYAEDRAQTRKLVRALAAPRPPVLCSQGGAIPDLVAHWRGRHRHDGTPAAKGSVWVLSFDADRLLAADYLGTA